MRKEEKLPWFKSLLKQLSDCKRLHHLILSKDPKRQTEKKVRRNEKKTTESEKRILVIDHQAKCEKKEKRCLRNDLHVQNLVESR